ncbi:hypothetical protein [Pseudomonas kurunegalensis]|uniref:hypothetical protein n=1 Tax=Pseudomonas kurunegalensis TaxID=485880 RepID=UPI002570ABEC|nr:hypothetical protein [Pseudomonas kurunegalensis]WJD64665.1 hypothetical protein QQ992_10350 [Pseudomonas kurunegalensis]
MKRQDYLNLPHVASFINWLATELDSQTLFRHQYVERRSGKKWQCQSLYNAFEAYRWNHPGNERLGFAAGGCPISNGIALAALRKDLLAATRNDALMLQATRDVMAWGGVTAGNGKWLETNRAGLSSMINRVRQAIDNGDHGQPVFRARHFRFNSGMTKVYALLCDDFLIYDSRVAAALGWLVVKYCEAHTIASVPEALCFPWAAAKEAKGASAPKRRNPATGALTFKRLRTGTHHLIWNLQASWLLGAVLAHPKAAASPFNGQTGDHAPLRALEAGLFMIGYDLGA